MAVNLFENRSHLGVIDYVRAEYLLPLIMGERHDWVLVIMSLYIALSNHRLTHCYKA